METAIAMKADKTFAFSAKGDGVVTEVSKTGIKVKYDNPSLGEDYALLGMSYGKAKGVTYPFTMITDRAVGYRFNERECLAYCKEFFDRDILNKRYVCLKLGTTAVIALAEIPETYEDSSLTSPELCEKFKSKSTDIKDVTVNFTDDVRNLKAIGTHVNYGDILCSILNQTVSSSDKYSEASIDLTDDISADSPTAKRHGIITDMEVFYNGDIEDLSDSLKEIVLAFNKRCEKQYRLTNGEHYRNGKVGNDFKANGTRLENNYLVLRFYITGEVPAGSGDKDVVAHQLKTTTPGIMKGPIIAVESNTKIEKVFSNLAIDDRKVNSPKPIGILTLISKLMASKIIDAYEKE